MQTIMEIIFRGARPNALQIAGLIIGFVGCIFIVAQNKKKDETTVEDEKVENDKVEGENPIE